MFIFFGYSMFFDLCKVVFVFIFFNIEKAILIIELNEFSQMLLSNWFRE